MTKTVVLKLIQLHCRCVVFRTTLFNVLHIQSIIKHHLSLTLRFRNDFRTRKISSSFKTILSDIPLAFVHILIYVSTQSNFVVYMYVVTTTLVICYCLLNLFSQIDRLIIQDAQISCWFSLPGQTFLCCGVRLTHYSVSVKLAPQSCLNVCYRTLLASSNYHHQT